MIALVIFLGVMFFMKRKEGFESSEPSKDTKESSSKKDNTDNMEDTKKEQIKIVLNQSVYSLSLIKDLNSTDVEIQKILTDTSTTDFQKLDKLFVKINPKK